jgi:hypothetical protein
VSKRGLTPTVDVPCEIAEALATVQRLQQAGQDIQLPEPPKTDDPATLKTHAVEVIGKTQQAIDQLYAVQGYYLIWLKENMPHGQFQAVCADEGIKPKTAQQRMQVARFLMRLEEPKAKRVSHLPFGRQLKLAQLGEDQLELLDARGALDEIDQKSAKDFDALIKAQKESEQRRQEAEKARTARDAAVARLEQHVHHNPMTFLNQARLVVAEHVSACRLLAAGAFRGLERELQNCPYDDDETKEMVVRHLLQGYREVAMAMTAFEVRVKERWAHLLHGNDDGLSVELTEAQVTEARDYIESLMSNWRAFNKPAGSNLESLFDLDPLNPEAGLDLFQHGKDRKRPGSNRQKGRKKTR